MFTGIIEAVGKIARAESRGGDMRATVSTGNLSMNEKSLGESIAVNGVCLTAVEFGPNFFVADVSRETLSRTTLGKLATGQSVNLERALLPTTRLGGHLVSGHVDGIGRITEKKNDGRSWRFRIEAPAELSRYIAEKGSICLDGISLTVNDIHDSNFGVNIVPHTLQATTLSELGVGSEINLEVDLLARYIERLLMGTSAKEVETQRNGVTLELLKRTGYCD
jgi:riboflavin synthase